MLPRVAGVIGAGVVVAGAAAAYALLHDRDEPNTGDPSTPTPQPTPDPIPTTPTAPTPPTTEPDGPEPDGPRRYHNPVAGFAPDPTVVRSGDGSYVIASTGSRAPLLTSTDLVNWKRAGHALEQLPRWSGKQMWAPHLARTGDHYTLLTSNHRPDGRWSIGYATSKRADGPYRDRGQLVSAEQSPTLPLDPFLLQASNGKDYLFWGSGHASKKSGIWAQGVKTARDGAMQLVGSPTRILSTKPGEPYDQRLVEGAWVTEHEGKFYMTYSAGHWEDHYAVKVAVADSPLGPYRRRPGPPLMEGNGKFDAPGHHSITTDDAGRSWMLYSAFANEGGKRQLMVDELTWGPNGPHMLNGTRRPSDRAQRPTAG